MVARFVDIKAKSWCRSLFGITALITLAACGAGPQPAPVARAPVQAPVEAPQETAPEQSPEENALALVEEADTSKITIGIMLPLSGPEEETGKALLRAATMALFDAYDPRLTLLPLDTAGDPIEAEARAHEAVERGVSVVLGPLLSDNVRAAGAVFERAGITMIGFSNDSTASAPSRFIMGFLPEAEVKRVVDYAVKEGLRNFGALVPVGRYGRRVQTAFGDTVVDAGASVLAIENYPPDADALFEPVKRLARYDERRREARNEVRFLRALRDDVTNEIADEIESAEVMEGVNFDAVLVPEGGALMRTLAPLLPFYEIDPNRVRLIGTGLWNDVGLLNEPPMQGAWFAAPTPEAPSEFLARFEAAYGEQPPRIATLAYDGMSLVAQLARTDATVTEVDESQTALADVSAGGEGDGLNGPELFAAERFTRSEGFVGVDGLFRFLQNGNIERALAVLEVNRRGFRTIDPAPDAFPAFGYSLSR